MVQIPLAQLALESNELVLLSQRVNTTQLSTNIECLTSDELFRICDFSELNLGMSHHAVLGSYSKLIVIFLHTPPTSDSCTELPESFGLTKAISRTHSISAATAAAVLVAVDTPGHSGMVFIVFFTKCFELNIILVGVSLVTIDY